MVRAYDARTGTLLWTDRPDDGGLWSSAMALTGSGDKLFVIGQTGCDFSSGTPGCQSAVRAYDAQTGALAWQDLDSAFSAADIVADGESIIVAGSHTDASGAVAPTIRAYDPDTGALAWENRADPGAGRIGGYSHVTVNGNGLFAGGSLSEAPLFITRLYVRALSLRPSSSR